GRSVFSCWWTDRHCCGSARGRYDTRRASSWNWGDYKGLYYAPTHNNFNRYYWRDGGCTRPDYLAKVHHGNANWWYGSYGCEKIHIHGKRYANNWVPRSRLSAYRD